MRIREAWPEDAMQIAQVHVDTWRDAYRGIVPEDYLEALSYEEWGARRCAALRDPEHGKLKSTFVAEDPAGAIMGFATGGTDRDPDPCWQGELYAIYVRKPLQRSGAGRALFRAVAERIRDAGLTSLRVWVLADNPARAFYEALGGGLLTRKPITLGRATLEEVSYGWPELDALIARL